MRGNEEKRIDAFSCVSAEERIPARHPIRPMRIMVNEILGSLDDELSAIYSDSGRPSIAPEYLLRASVLQILYSVLANVSLWIRSISTSSFDVS